MCCEYKRRLLQELHAEKIRKTLYLPEWLEQILTSEGDKYDGPGVVAAAAINGFNELNDENKKLMLKRFRDKEIEIAYAPNETTSANSDELKKIPSTEIKTKPLESKGKKPTKRRRRGSGFLDDLPEL